MQGARNVLKVNFKTALRMTLLRAENYGDLALRENIDALCYH